MPIVDHTPSAGPAISAVTDPWIRSVADLLDFLQLDPAASPAPLAGHGDFPFLTTRPYASRMAKRDWRDPLLLQVLPRAEEGAEHDGFVDDPVGDRGSEVAPGLLYKYRGRALMIASPLCAVHCRYCFRRAYPFYRSPVTEQERAAAWEWLDGHPDVTELVLSGGDPLMLDNEELGELLARARVIPHLRTLRIHTRMPVVLPGRVDDALAGLVAGLCTAMSVVIVIHANHEREIDGHVADAVMGLRHAGALLLNQSVLLRDVNDSVEALAGLSRRLVSIGVVPYYLHQLDRVTGARHFETDEDQGRLLVRELRIQLPGYAVPRYVKEIAGQGGKTVLC